MEMEEEWVGVNIKCKNEKCKNEKCKNENNIND